MRWTSIRSIRATPERVFRAVADPEEFQRAIPGGSTVEYLGPARSGVGTKFRATRLVKGKPSAFDQEVTEFVPGDHIQLVNVTHGTPWVSVFRVKPAGAETTLELTMDAAPKGLLQRVMMPLIAPMVQKALETDMDAVKAFCER